MFLGWTNHREQENTHWEKRQQGSSFVCDLSSGDELAQLPPCPTLYWTPMVLGSLLIDYRFHFYICWSSLGGWGWWFASSSNLLLFLCPGLWAPSRCPFDSHKPASESQSWTHPILFHSQSNYPALLEMMWSCERKLEKEKHKINL